MSYEGSDRAARSSLCDWVYVAVEKVENLLLNFQGCVSG